MSPPPAPLLSWNGGRVRPLQLYEPAILARELGLGVTPASLFPEPLDRLGDRLKKPAFGFVWPAQRYDETTIPDPHDRAVDLARGNIVEHRLGIRADLIAFGGEVGFRKMHQGLPLEPTDSLTAG